MPRWLWITLAVCVAVLFWVARESPVSTAPASGPGVPLACPPLSLPARPGEPLQVPVSETPVLPLEGHRLRPLAAFAIEARVLGREDYHFDRGAAVSPTDLALGWGRMADPGIYRQLDIRQSGRWYHYRWGPSGPPIPLQEIIRSSANMHLVPADAAVAGALDRVRPDQTVRLRGWLVELQGEDGWTWRSSLTREDSGDGACELVYVCEISAY